MDYRELTQAEYDRKLRLLIAGTEGMHANAQDVGDGRATIGWGYTLNRDNNVAIWRAAGVALSDDQWRTLTVVDAAHGNDKTRTGLTFTKRVNEAEADQLLRASMAEYEGPANLLSMPLSDERVAVVSLAYNRGVGNIAGSPGRNVPEHPVMDAIRNGDRAEAWFQIRYNCWGSDELANQYPSDRSNEGGLRKRRFAEAQVFGLYDDPAAVPADEARSVYRAFQLHRDEVERVEREFGVTAEGDEARRNRIAQANRDYPALVNEYGVVPTIHDALEPARVAVMRDMRRENPHLADRMDEADFRVGRIHVNAGRDLQDEAVVARSHPGVSRTQNAVRREQRNASIETVDPTHAATIDSRKIRGNVEIDSNDLLIGMGGDDVLRSHRGNDVLIGGEGRDRMEGGPGQDAYVIGAGDTILDSDGWGEVRWGREPLVGGIRSESDPVNTYRSADGRLVYALQNGELVITDTRPTDQGAPESAVIENFQDGHLGIHLSDGAEPNQVGAAGGPFNDPTLDSYYAALLKGDSDGMDRIARDFAQSPEGQQMARWGNDLYEQQQIQEQQAAQTQSRGRSM
jgi:GH24 family phage-related lysozyme (muramidase)